MKEVNLTSIISEWIKNDDCMSKHMTVDGCHIMEICRNDTIIRSPMASRSYGIIEETKFRSVDNTSLPFMLSCTMPNFFTLLRAYLRKMHNKVLWCGEEMENNYLVDPNDNPNKHNGNMDA